MAFDRPLEADKIDDLGLFSSFLRAPIIGPIMWMIGGSSAQRKEEEEKEKVLTKKALLERESDHHDYEDALYNRMPESISSDISDESDESETFSSDDEPNTLPEIRSKMSTHPHSSNNSSLRRSNRLDHSLYKRTRKMSWSDESGQNLVEICDETKKPSHEPVSITHSSLHKPIKPAIRKSTSFQDAMSSKSKFKSSQCVPSGLIGGKDGIIMPSCNGMKNSNGYISPQWGWYISTTPPTPEKYIAKKNKEPKESSGQSTNLNGEEQSRNGSSQIDPQKPVFTRQIKGIPKSVSDWPSVPL